MTELESQRSQMLLKVMELDEIYFGIFSMVALKNKNNKPELG